jgi:hypothetical protein
VRRITAVVPANAGTHNHRIQCLSEPGLHPSQNYSLWLWVPDRASLVRDDSEFLANSVFKIQFSNSRIHKPNLHRSFDRPQRSETEAVIRPRLAD